METGENQDAKRKRAESDSLDDHDEASLLPDSEEDQDIEHEFEDQEDTFLPGSFQEEKDRANHGTASARRALRSRLSSLPLRQARSVPRKGTGPGHPCLQGLSEKSVIIHYREGEPLRDLQRFIASDGRPSQVEVRVPAELVLSSNRQVRGRQLWGTDVYTDDSDVVAALMHSGFISSNLSTPSPDLLHYRASLTPLPPRQTYESKARNGVRSRAWCGARHGCSYQVDACFAITASGMSVELDSWLARAPAAVPTFLVDPEPKHLNTRSATANTTHPQRGPTREVTVQYNLCNEPWMKYSMSAVADRGLSPSQWTSTRLRKEVILLETHSQRFELSCESCGRTGGGGSAHDVDADSARPPPATEEKAPEDDLYRWVKCVMHHPLAALELSGLPLPLEEVELMYSKLTWEELRWSNSGVQVKDKLFPIVRLQFMPRRKVLKATVEGKC
eukprot:CAMPEP_0196590780 /NCGR_PEP_ID=MMETSP1081-20130531/67537_1 /TAXON_ID=36882 /ORGANISM="Pyramimonas amylifera, Strain CCMP720" /LENGTH=446 /DNA_ID=CAMNT_0041913977 /DNA_START=33 /DNA_END=1373 /DNA_ORIENTATION=-